ncbi:hypothetical protein [uncultured Thiodictyon sp.]|jgi:hypothetical protein|uniref:hypothetical protein n=1 Tax=uncultured Thiodictyon sp. TaxID=1846217 RepID=UPI0025EA43CC|nr:hypothetical protein [uncultured Thiodictyon sp.]
MACSRPANTFKTLGGGVPVHYDREPPLFPLGSKGKPASFAVESSFENQLDATMTELWKKCPLGKADIILSAGAFVCKSGQHGQGLAFDLDGIWWGSRLVLAKQYHSDSRAYLGIEAILRKHVGTVLNFEYNAAHQDHWHLDPGTSPGFDSGSRSRVLYLQMALRKLFAQPVKVDGLFSDETRKGVHAVFAALGLATAAEMDTDSKVDKALAKHWMAFLDAAATEGLAALAPTALARAVAPTPLQLLATLHDTLEDELPEHPARKTIERAIENFADHPDIAAVLASSA